MVYTSGSLALAALELLVHVDRTQLPSDLVQVEIEIPDNLPMDRVEIATLPPQWREYPAPEALQRLGDDWLASQSAPVLQVPSAVIPQDQNYLINPGHPRASEVTAVGTRGFVYDPRLVI